MPVAAGGRRHLARGRHPHLRAFLGAALLALVAACAGDPVNVASRESGTTARSKTVPGPGALIDGDETTFSTLEARRRHAASVMLDLGRVALLTRSEVLLAPGTTGRFRILARERESLPWVELVDRTRAAAVGRVADAFPPKRARYVLIRRTLPRLDAGALRIAEVRIFGTR